MNKQVKQNNVFYHVLLFPMLKRCTMDVNNDTLFNPLYLDEGI